MKCKDRLTSHRNALAEAGIESLEKLFQAERLYSPEDRAVYTNWAIGTEHASRPFYYEQYIDTRENDEGDAEELETPIKTVCFLCALNDAVFDLIYLEGFGRGVLLSSTLAKHFTLTSGAHPDYVNNKKKPIGAVVLAMQAVRRVYIPFPLGSY